MPVFDAESGAGPDQPGGRHLKAFRDYVTGAEAAMEGRDHDRGGFLVPIQYSNELIDGAGGHEHPAHGLEPVLSVGGSTAFKVPTMTKSTAGAITDEEGNYDEAEPTFNEVTFTPWKYTKLIKVSRSLMLDSRIDLMSQVMVPDAAQAFAAAEKHCIHDGQRRRRRRKAL